MPPGLLPSLYGLECPIVFHSHTDVKRNEPMMLRRKEMEWNCNKKVPKKILSTQIMHENPLGLIILYLDEILGAEETSLETLIYQTFPYSGLRDVKFCTNIYACKNEAKFYITISCVI